VRWYVTVGTNRISLEQLRKVLGLESVKDAARNIIQEARLPIWANLRQRALILRLRENRAFEALGRIRSKGSEAPIIICWVAAKLALR
jgi:hypothetical protein